jgi:hypothetical protein
MKGGQTSLFGHLERSNNYDDSHVAAPSGCYQHCMFLIVLKWGPDVVKVLLVYCDSFLIIDGTFANCNDTSACHW